MLQALQGHVSCESDDKYIPPAVEKPTKERKKCATKGKKGKGRTAREKSSPIPNCLMEDNYDSQEHLSNSKANIMTALTRHEYSTGAGSESDSTGPPGSESNGERSSSGNVSSCPESEEASKSLASNSAWTSFLHALCWNWSKFNRAGRSFILWGLFRFTLFPSAFYWYVTTLELDMYSHRSRHQPNNQIIYIRCSCQLHYIFRFTCL